MLLDSVPPMDEELEHIHFACYVFSSTSFSPTARASDHISDKSAKSIIRRVWDPLRIRTIKHGKRFGCYFVL